jgi:O-antigen ligase
MVRTTVLILGGMVILQSSSELDAPKILYLAVAAACVLGSLLAVAHRRSSSDVEVMLPLLIASIALGLLVFLSFPVALASGTPPARWLRDAASYLLVATVPFVALDAYWSASRRSLLALLVVAGALATAAYTIAWMDLRHIAEAPIDRLALPSGQLTSALFAALIALALAGERHRWLWTLAVGLDLALFVLVGGRGRLPLLALPVALAAVAWPVGARRLAGSLAGQAASAIVAFAVLYWIIAPGAFSTLLPGLFNGLPAGPAATPNPLDNRIGSVSELIMDIGADASFQERLAQTRAAWDVFAANPIVGGGPGRETSWIDTLGVTVRSYNLDTPVSVLAKFGLVGAVIVLAWMSVLLRFALSLIRRARTSWVTLALTGYALLILYAWLFVSPLEDKGFGFALITLLALGLTADHSGSTAIHAPKVTRRTG